MVMGSNIPFQLSVEGFRSIGMDVSFGDVLFSSVIYSGMAAIKVIFDANVSSPFIGYNLG